MNHKTIVVVGGGAAGLMAAIAAARNGARVIVLEQLNRVGKKLLATGNGRCNLTNINTQPHHYHGQVPQFVRGALGQFGVEQTMDFFEYLGVHCKVEEGGKVYPCSDQASSVLDVLRYELEALGVEERCEAKVKEIRPKGQGFQILLEEGQSLKADRVIVATGGAASPQLGAKGSGYQLVEKLGHRMVPLFPALVQLRLESPHLKHLKGVKFVGEVTLEAEGKPLRKEEGEILFTDYGISGPPILQLSRGAEEQRLRGITPWLTLDLFPQYSFQELLELLQLRCSYQPQRTLEMNLVGLIHKKLISVVLKETGLYQPMKQGGNVTPRELKAIAQLLKAWRWSVIGTQSWNHAQVTAGGIDVRDVNPKTLESKLVKGLYLVGELLDIDGDCGGFNLQWAWSSGYVAGDHASLDE